MEPTNYPFSKEHDLPNLDDYVPAVNLQGCTPHWSYSRGSKPKCKSPVKKIPSTNLEVFWVCKMEKKGNISSQLCMYTLVVFSDNTSVIIIIIIIVLFVQNLFLVVIGTESSTTVLWFLKKGWVLPLVWPAWTSDSNGPAQLADLGVTPCECWAKNMFSLIEQKQEVAIFRDLQGYRWWRKILLISWGW